MKWFAPILSFTTEEIYRLVRKTSKSIHLEKFLDFPKKFENNELYSKWVKLLKIRDACNLSIEEKRASKEIGSSLEAELLIKLNESNQKIVKGIDLSELCITSSAKVVKSDLDEMIIETKKAEGEKCPICWKITISPCERPNCNFK